MDQQNNTAALNDSAGVLPMDTGAIINGIHDEYETDLLAINTSAKKGRGRPPKSAGSTKVSVSSDTPKRARGRPPKSGEAPSPAKKVVVIPNKKEETLKNEDDSKKKRGRPSKTGTPKEQINGISKPQIQVAPVVYDEEQENVDEPAKRKRGRPSRSSPKPAVAPVTSSASKESSPTKQRGRPPGSARGKKPVAKPITTATANGSGRKRGRPKKAAAVSPTPLGTTPANETTTPTPNNVQ